MATEANTPETAAVAAPVVQRPNYALRVIVAGIVVIVLVLVAALSTVWWALRSESGTAWVLSYVPGLQVSGLKGALLSDFEADRVAVRFPGGKDTLALTGLGWRGLSIEKGLKKTSRVRIVVEDLHATRIDAQIAPGTNTEPLKPPADMQLPVEIELRSVRVGELHANALGDKPLRNLAARLHIGANGGAEHRIDQISVAWDRLLASGTASIASSGPMDLKATIDLTQQAAAAPGAAAPAPASAPPAANAPPTSTTEATAIPPWSAHATLAGPLTAPLLQATLSAQPTPQRPAQSLDARATLRPFASWPLGDLQATARSLDLSAFGSALPATVLNIDANAASTGLDQPALLSLTLANAEAGRWNEGKLPVRHLAIELRAQPNDTRVLELRTFDADLGTKQQSGGRIIGQGRWTAATWNLDATLKSLQPSLLDAHAAAMQLSGPVKLVGTGFDAATADDYTVDLKADLTGQLAALLGNKRPARNVQLKLDAALNPLRIELRDAKALAGGAQATLSGLVTRVNTEAPWVIKGKTALVDFDPSPWWPGTDDSPWRQGPHKLNAKGDLDITLPADVGQRKSTDLLTALRGQAAIRFDNSLLAGVPLTGEATLRSTDGAVALPTLKLDAAGNSLQAQGRIGVAAKAGANDAWDVTIAAPSLDRLAPIYRLFQPRGASTAFTGALVASAKATGRWPAMSTQGELAASGVRVGDASVQRAQAKWQLGTSLNANVDLQATLTGATLGVAAPPAGAPSLETLQLTLKGTGRAHTLDLRAESKSLPPAWIDALQSNAAGRSAPANTSAAASSPGATAVVVAPSAASASASTTTPSTPTNADIPQAIPVQANARTLATLRAQGGLLDAPSSPAAGWRGSIQQIDVRSTLANAPALLATRDVAVDLQWAPGPLRATVQPGRAEVLGAALRWSRIAFQGAVDATGTTAARPAQIDAQADIDPAPIAPVLARLQPAFGWGGDLTIAGHVSLKSAPTFTADIVIERSRGDLTVTDETGTQSLGLSDLRVALNASNGIWNFTQALAGKTVGVAAGAVVVRTSPQALWPTADAPLQGVLELQVANLGTWGTWVPAGWRLDGALRASASIAGRFGAPEYTGQVVGTKLGVRNLLLGVNVAEGDVAIALQGSTARIERFAAKAGNGTVRLEGNASLGVAPKAQLKLTADKFQLLGRVDRRIVASGQAQLLLDKDTLALDGTFGVDEGLIDFTRSDAPTLSEDVVVVRGKQPDVPSAAESAASAAAAAQAAPPAATGRKVALDLNVTLGEKLRVRGRGLDTGLRGELHITSPGGRMAVNGTVRTADGTYQAYGQKLTIDRGLITFAGSTDNPRLDIEATRPNIDTRVGVQVTGTTANPRVRLFSEPELSEIDKLSWLVMGRASDGLGRTDTALLQRAALALLSGEGPGVTDKITKAIGLDEISLRQSEGEVKETVISLGKQISRRWYVGYERGLNATSGSWQLIYRVAQRFTLRAQSGLDNSLDAIWTWRWN